MKEDILEQLVEDWLVSQDGWFAKHNVKFRPQKDDDYNSKLDSVHSDIDILAFSPKKRGVNRVSVVTCKSWQAGFNIEKWLQSLESEAEYHEPSVKFKKRESWKGFRELVSEKWMRAFIHTLDSQTGQKEFTYYIAVTKLSGKNIEENRKKLEASEIIRKRFSENGAKINIKLLPLSEIVEDIVARLQDKETPVVENTNIGRTLQLLIAAKIL